MLALPPPSWLLPHRHGSPWPMLGLRPSCPCDQPRPRRGPAPTLLTLAYLLEGTGYIVTGTFLVAIVEQMRGLSGFGSSVWVVVGLAAAPLTVLWTALAARVGSPPALMLAYVVQACGSPCHCWAERWRRSARPSFWRDVHGHYGPYPRPGRADRAARTG